MNENVTNTMGATNTNEKVAEEPLPPITSFQETHGPQAVHTSTVHQPTTMEMVDMLNNFLRTKKGQNYIEDKVRKRVREILHNKDLARQDQIEKLKSNFKLEGVWFTRDLNTDAHQEKFLNMAYGQSTKNDLLYVFRSSVAIMVWLGECPGSVANICVEARGPRMSTSGKILPAVTMGVRFRVPNENPPRYVTAKEAATFGVCPNAICEYSPDLLAQHRLEDPLNLLNGTDLPDDFTPEESAQHISRRYPNIFHEIFTESHPVQCLRDMVLTPEGMIPRPPPGLEELLVCDYAHFVTDYNSKLRTCMNCENMNVRITSWATAWRNIDAALEKADLCKDFPRHGNKDDINANFKIAISLYVDGVQREYQRCFSNLIQFMLAEECINTPIWFTKMLGCNDPLDHDPVCDNEADDPSWAYLPGFFHELQDQRDRYVMCLPSAAYARHQFLFSNMFIALSNFRDSYTNIQSKLGTPLYNAIQANYPAKGNPPLNITRSHNFYASLCGAVAYLLYTAHSRAVEVVLDKMQPSVDSFFKAKNSIETYEKAPLNRLGIKLQPSPTLKAAIQKKQLNAASTAKKNTKSVPAAPPITTGGTPLDTLDEDEAISFISSEPSPFTPYQPSHKKAAALFTPGSAAELDTPVLTSSTSVTIHHLTNNLYNNHNMFPFKTLSNEPNNLYIVETTPQQEHRKSDGQQRERLLLHNHSGGTPPLGARPPTLQLPHSPEKRGQLGIGGVDSAVIRGGPSLRPTRTRARGEEELTALPKETLEQTQVPTPPSRKRQRLRQSSRGSKRPRRWRKRKGRRNRKRRRTQNTRHQPREDSFQAEIPRQINETVYPCHDHMSDHAMFVDFNAPANANLYNVYDDCKGDFNNKVLSNSTLEKLTASISNIGVNNISSYVPSTDELRVLALGLNFIPEPHDITNCEIYQALDEFTDTLLWKEQLDYIGSRINDTSDSTLSELRRRLRKKLYAKRSNQSEVNYNNKERGYIKSYETQEYIHKVRERFREDISNKRTKTYHRLNACESREIDAILWDLRNNQLIIVKPADKNLGPTIMDRRWYVEAGELILKDTSTYRTIESFNINTIRNELLFILATSGQVKFKDTSPRNFMYADWRNESLQTLKARHITYSSSLADIFMDAFADTDSIQACRSYFLPKLQKLPFPFPCPPPLLPGKIPPVRPICASIGWVTYAVSVYLDILLKPLMVQLPSYIMNSSALAKLLENKLFPSDCALLAADVESLYPSIDINRGLDALDDALKGNNVHPDTRRFITHLARWVLYNNITEFNGKLYLQIRGTAMGTPCAVVIACIYMGTIEKKVWTSLANRRVTPLLDYRYIDDLLIIAKSKLEAQLILDTFNSIEPLIRLTGSISDTTTDFLDLTIYKGSRFGQYQKFDLDVYQKPSNKFLFLPHCSCHPEHVFQGWIRGYIGRLRINCTDDLIYHLRRCQFWDQLAARGYAEIDLTQFFKYNPKRSTLLAKIVTVPKTNASSTSLTFFKIRYSQRTNQLLPVLKRALQASPAMLVNKSLARQLGPKGRPLIALSNSNKFADKLVSAKLLPDITESRVTQTAARHLSSRNSFK